MNRLVRSSNSFWRRSESSASVYDVDIQTGQLAGKAHVLTAAADCQRKLILGHNHFDPLGPLRPEPPLLTSAGCSAFTRKVGWSSFQGMMSIFSP